MSTAFTKFKIIFVLLTAVCLAPQSLHAQKPAMEKVSGKVMTTDGKPAEWVTVALKDTFYGTTTDRDGNFYFQAPAGTYTLKVFSITCHSKEFPVTIKKGGPNNFSDLTVIENLKQLETVVVTGQFSPQSLENSVFKVKVIDREQIERKGATDLQALLNTEIGIRISNDLARGENDFELMGSGGHNVKVLVDGMPRIDRNPERQSLSQIDISIVERVEIVEGPMSVVYGTDALAGVINIITKKPDPAAGKNTWSVNASVTEETAGTEYEPFNGKGIHRENILLNWAGKSGIYAQASATRLDNGGWKGDATGRELTWPGREQTLLNGMAGYSKNGLNVWYKLDYSENKTLKYHNAASGTTDVRDETYYTDRMNHQLQGEWNINNRVSVNGAVSYESLERRSRNVMINPETGDKWLSDAPSAQDTAQIRELFSRATVTWNVTPSLSMQGGMDFDWSEASGDRIEGEPHITDFAAYVSAEWSATEWLDIRPGLRTVYNSVYDAPPVIPSLQTKFRLNRKMDLRVSYGYGFRAPKLRELYFRFFDGANHDVTGNTGLKAEHSNNLSSSLTWRLIHKGELRLTSTATVFYADFRDKIVTVITDPGSTPMKATYKNLSKDKRTGGTLENSLTWKGLSANLSFSMIGRYNTLKDDPDYQNADMSTYRFSPELSASASYLFEKTGTGLNFFYKYTHKKLEYTAAGNGNTELIGKDPFHMADFTLTQKAGKLITLTAGIKNIFNVKMVENSAGGGMGSSGNSSFEGCGTSFMLGASFSLNSK